METERERAEEIPAQGLSLGSGKGYLKVNYLLFICKYIYIYSLPQKTKQNQKFYFSTFLVPSALLIAVLSAIRLLQYTLKVCLTDYLPLILQFTIT